MKVVFVSNYLNHHQIPFCEALRSYCEDFWFIDIERGPNSGIKVNEKRDYAIYYQDEIERCRKIILDADAVIFGACQNELVTLRMKENKLSFIYSERFLKRGNWVRYSPNVRRVINNIV